MGFPKYIRKSDQKVFLYVSKTSMIVVLAEPDEHGNPGKEHPITLKNFKENYEVGE